MAKNSRSSYTAYTLPAVTRAKKRTTEKKNSLTQQCATQIESFFLFRKQMYNISSWIFVYFSTVMCGVSVCVCVLVGVCRCKSVLVGVSRCARYIVLSCYYELWQSLLCNHNLPSLFWNFSHSSGTFAARNRLSMACATALHHIKRITIEVLYAFSFAVRRTFGVLYAVRISFRRQKSSKCYAIERNTHRRQRLWTEKRSKLSASILSRKSDAVDIIHRQFGKTDHVNWLDCVASSHWPNKFLHIGHNGKLVYWEMSTALELVRKHISKSMRFLSIRFYGSRIFFQCEIFFRYFQAPELICRLCDFRQ